MANINLLQNIINKNDQKSQCVFYNFILLVLINTYSSKNKQKKFEEK